jgi:hypothetical protein
MISTTLPFVLRLSKGERKVFQQIAPVRARTSYQPIYYYPGTPPKVISEPLENDVAAMKEDIAKAKAQVCAVIIFIHWS